MRVAITGATGLIGSHCTARAVAEGHHVRMVVRNPAKAAHALALHAVAAPPAPGAPYYYYRKRTQTT